jgi:predicted CXXCH cytochrome family protein
VKPRTAASRWALLIGAPFLVSAAAQRAPAQLQPDSRRACAMCHLEWVDAFEQAGADLLIEKPAKPTSANSSVCLGCHDGSIVDSRRRVWIEHGHRTGVSPPQTMRVPGELPLDEGKLACRTCHTAHRASAEDHFGAAFFIRVQNDASQLCQMCHPEKARGPTLGSHPVGGMPWPIPPELIRAGAKAVQGQRQLYCQVCHMAHGSRGEHLLVMGVSGNELCLTCHKKLRPRMWRPAREGVHPDRPVIHEPEQFKAIERMGTRLGAENRLICLSCHRLHEGKSGRFMLAEPLEGSSFCMQCHPYKKPLVGTEHDLRKTAPESRNRLGMTPTESGPCGACHLFHNLAIRPNPGNFDETGICASCHRIDGLASKTGNMKYTHPVHVPAPTMPPAGGLPLASRPGDGKAAEVIVCLTCHDPHNGPLGFVRKPYDALCGTCHAEMTGRIPKGPHDASTGKAKWPAPVSEDHKCAACHKPHSSDPITKLWTVSLPQTQPAREEPCMACHKDTGWATGQSGDPKQVLHLRAKITASQPGPEPSKDATSRPSDRMVCQTCHDPHRGPAPIHLLRAPEASRPGSVCFGCHPDTADIGVSMHGRLALQQAQFDARVCGPCHEIHARVKGGPREMLWTGNMSDEGKTPSEKRCLGCHGPGGRATQPTLFWHPHAPLKALDWQGLCKLYPDLKELPAGQITCLTCHITHGRKIQANENVPLVQLAAARPMLRPNISQTLCASCHGYDALRHYLYFHYPEKRPK